MGREGMFDDSGYRGFEECSSRETCCVEAYQQGREKREEEIVDLIYAFEKNWNKESHKRLPKIAITELIGLIYKVNTEEDYKKWVKEQKNE